MFEMISRSVKKLRSVDILYKLLNPGGVLVIAEVSFISNIRKYVYQASSNGQLSCLSSIMKHGLGVQTFFCTHRTEKFC